MRYDAILGVTKALDGVRGPEQPPLVAWARGTVTNGPPILRKLATGRVVRLPQFRAGAVRGACYRRRFRERGSQSLELTSALAVVPADWVWWARVYES